MFTHNKTTGIEFMARLVENWVIKIDDSDNYKLKLETKKISKLESINLMWYPERKKIDMDVIK